MSLETPVNLISDAPQARVERFIREWAEGPATAGPLPSERELAKRLGVGRTTVRRALEALSRDGVLQRDGRRVRQVPPVRVSAGILAKTIVMLLPEVEETDQVIRAHWTEYGSLGCARAIRSAGLNALAVVERNVNEAELASIAAQKPMGFLIPDTFNDISSTVTAAAVVARAGVPMVVYGGAAELAPYDRVMSDHEAGSAMLTRHMLSLGCRRIIQAWPKPWERYWFAARQRGYEQALREAGLQPLPTIETPRLQRIGAAGGDFHQQVRTVAGYIGPTLVGPDAPDAILCSSDRDVPYLIAACRLFGREQGRNIHIAGYDDYWPFCEERAHEPVAPTATVSKLNELMGGVMVQMLLDRIGGKLPEGPQTRVIAPRLVAGAALAAAGQIQPYHLS